MAINSLELFYTEVGKLVRAERIKQDLTQEDLAKKDDSLTRTMIANIETGRQQILLHTFITIAEVLEVSFEKLLPKNKIDNSKNKIDNNIVKKEFSNSKEAQSVFTNFFDDSKSKKE